jgi:Cu(I)/Ag(I) efflux system membrane fusion protein
MKSIKILFIFLLVGSFLQSCSKKNEIYYCPMHPTYTADKPGQCPICNMDLVKKESQENHEGHSDSASVVEVEEKVGFETSENILTLPFDKQQSIGIKTDFVKKRNLEKELSIYSNVAYDPELYNALVEYKSARQSTEFLNDSSQNLSSNLDLRLRQLGLNKTQIRLWTSGQRDPIELLLGGKSGRGHIYSQIYESDLSIAKVGLSILFRTDVYPDLIFKGAIKSIDTILDKNNRTLRIRSEVSDPKQLLKPQMFGKVVISIPLKNLLSLPTSSILDTGNHKIVYVRISEDKFKSVMVKTGFISGEWTEVTDGLKEGDEVVSESTFLIDSEAKIRFGNDSSHNH